MTKPQITINGSSAQTLLDEYSGVIASIEGTISKLQQLSIHPRDYQIIPGAWVDAQRERNDFVAQLHNMHKQLEEVAMELADQIN